MKKTCFLMFTCLLVSPAFGQLTITSSNFQALIGSTQNITAYTSQDTTGLRALINTSGSNQTWNVGVRTYQSGTSSTTFLNYLGGAPLANDPAFSGSNTVTRGKSPSSPNITSWGFYKLDATGFTLYGFVIDSSGTYSKFTYSPPLLGFKLPMTFNTAWNGTTTTNFPGGSFTEIYDELVDGYGTVTTPAGNVSCLRLREKTTTQFSFGGITFSTTGYDYAFIGQDGFSYAEIHADSTKNPQSVSYFQKTVTSVARSSDIPPNSFELAQNYPNPFNPSTTIEFSLPRSGYTNLKVFNTLGEEVATLVAGNLSAGRYKAQWNANGLTSGVYFYQLQAVDASSGSAHSFVETKKLILLK